MLTVAIVVIIMLVALASFAYGALERSAGGIVGGIVATVLAVIVFALGSFTIVPTRQVGIPVTFGVTGQPMPNGFNWKAPWTSVELMDMTIQSLDSSEDNPTVAKDVDNMDVFVHNNVRWALREEATDDIFNDTKSIQGDNMVVISDKFLQPALRAVVSDVMATYNPLDSKKPSNTEVAAKIKDGLEARVGDRFNISSVEVTLIDVTEATKERINMLNAERANTRIAEQKKATATAEAAANRALAESLSKDPNVLVRECLRLIDESKPMPAGFQCWPSTGGSVVIPSK